jgi:2-polyprenyl-6-methoxyphenol hydroxylase-like FAD-dependent oxidoreductase
VVVGGGIGGLSVALALHRRGWRVTVLERAPELREVGAGLSLMANALRALDALGLSSALRSNAHAEAPGGVRDRRGRWLSRMDAAEMVRQLGTGALGVHRATLHRILREALPASSLHTGAEVEHVDSDSDHATVRYRGPDGPRTLHADLVVGADGLRSRLRAQLWPEIPAPVYAGSTAWRAAIAFPEPIPTAITWGPAAEFGMVPIGDGWLYWYAARNAPPGGHAPDELAAVREHFGTWHDPIPALLAATPPGVVLRDDIHGAAVVRAGAGGAARRRGPRDDAEPRAGRRAGHRGRGGARRGLRRGRAGVSRPSFRPAAQSFSLFFGTALRLGQIRQCAGTIGDYLVTDR